MAVDPTDDPDVERALEQVSAARTAYQEALRTGSDEARSLRKTLDEAERTLATAKRQRAISPPADTGPPPADTGPPPADTGP